MFLVLLAIGYLGAVLLVSVVGAGLALLLGGPWRAFVQGLGNAVATGALAFGLWLFTLLGLVLVSAVDADEDLGLGPALLLVFLLAVAFVVAYHLAFRTPRPSKPA